MIFKTPGHPQQQPTHGGGQPQQLYLVTRVWNMRKAAPGTVMAPVELDTIKGKIQQAMAKHKAATKSKTTSRKKPVSLTLPMLANKHCAQAMDNMLVWMLNGGVTKFMFGAARIVFCLSGHASVPAMYPCIGWLHNF